jgi:hypothetical protein
MVLLVALFLFFSVVHHILPVDEALDVCAIVAVILLSGLLLYAIYAAWSVRNDG